MLRRFKISKDLVWNHRYRVTTEDGEYSFNRFPSSVGIKNWNVILRGQLYAKKYGFIDGTFLRVKDNTWFLPALDLDSIFNFLASDDQRKEQYYLRAADYHIPECFKCKGGGRVDWVSKATTVRKEDFIIDSEVIYQYQHHDGKIRPELYISKAKLDKGFTHCPNCKGTGINLDARFKMLNGFNELKRRIKIYKFDQVYERVKTLMA